ncbi:hypothetical protein LDC_1445, partial [sediment metagenome]
QMKDGILGWQDGSLNQVGFFQGAFLAKAHRADITAAIALDATVEVFHPETEPSLGAHLINTGNRIRLVDALLLFTHLAVIGVGLAAFTGYSQLSWTRNAYWDYFFGLELFPLEKLDQTAGVAATHEHAECGFGEGLCQADQSQVQRVPRIPGFILITQ